MNDTETPRPISDALLFEAIAKIITNAAPDNGHWTEWEPEVMQIISLVRSHPPAQSEVCIKPTCDKEACDKQSANGLQQAQSDERPQND